MIGPPSLRIDGNMNVSLKNMDRMNANTFAIVVEKNKKCFFEIVFSISIFVYFNEKDLKLFSLVE